MGLGIRAPNRNPNPKTMDQMNEIIILNKSDLVGSVGCPFCFNTLYHHSIDIYF